MVNITVHPANSLGMFDMLLMLVITMIGSYLVLKPSMASWEIPDEEGRERFIYFKGKWPTIFAVATFIGGIVGSYAWWLTNDTAIGYIMGLLTALLGIAAWTDIHVFKVPADLSVLTLWLSIGFFLAMLFTGNAYHMQQSAHIIFQFMPIVQFDMNGLWFFIITLVLVAIGFFVALRAPGDTLFMSGMFLMFFGSWLFLYGMVRAVGLLPAIEGNEYWAEFFYVLLVAYPFLGIAAGYYIFLPPDNIGGADTIIFWTFGFGLSFWISSFNLFVALLVAFLLQLVLHVVAKPLKLGYYKDVKNSRTRQSFIDRKFYKNLNKLINEHENSNENDPEINQEIARYSVIRSLILSGEPVRPNKKHKAYPVPFIPMLSIGVLGMVMVMLIFPVLVNS